MPRLTPARCSVQIGQTGSVVGKLVAPRPCAHLAPFGNFRCTSAIQTHNLKVTGSNPIPATSHQTLENIMFSGAFCCREFGQLCSFVEAAGGKSQRKFGGITRDMATKFRKTAANGPIALEREHREINVSSLEPAQLLISRHTIEGDWPSGKFAECMVMERPLMAQSGHPADCPRRLSAKRNPPNMLSAVDEMPKLAHSESPASRIPRRAHEARAVTANNRPIPLGLMR